MPKKIDTLTLGIAYLDTFFGPLVVVLLLHDLCNTVSDLVSYKVVSYTCLYMTLTFTYTVYITIIITVSPYIPQVIPILFLYMKSDT